MFMAKKIVVDPFYDGAGDAIGTNSLEDAELNRILPAGPGGLRGTVIPTADAQPDEPHHAVTEIHVDPDIPGQSTVVKVGAMQAERIAAAMQETAQVDPRVRASAVYNALSNEASAATSTTAAAAVGPLKAFGTVTSEGTTQQMPDKVAAPAAPVAPTAPTTWVTFEIEGFGEHRAPYHRVIRSNSNLVLVYDTNCEGTQRFFPRTTDQPLGIHIAGESVAYYAHTTGIEFSDAGVDYCVLLIEHEAPLTSGLDNEME